MNKQIKKVIGTFGGVMAMAAFLTVPTYASSTSQQVTKVKPVIVRTATTNIAATTSPWDGILVADVKSYAHIRLSDTVDSEIVGALYKGAAAQILEQGTEWTKITSGDVTGYIRNDLFVIGESAKALYESTNAVEGADPTNLEHKAITKEQLNENLQKIKEEQATQAVSVGSGELDLLAAIIQCEAGGESYEGKIAVGAVIMNRVNSGKFPNSITDVVYQGGQFSPVASGKLSRTLSSGARSDCYDAARDVLNGANNVGSALYFNSGSGKGLQIGNQHFY